jgi:hypothetical protein
MLVGPGNKILVWRDPWILDMNSFLPQPRDIVCTPQSMAVADLMTQDKLGWDMTKLNELFNDATVQAIKNIPYWSLGQEDRWIWLKTNSSELTIKSAYKELTHQDSNPHASTIFGKIWKLPYMRDSRCTYGALLLIYYLLRLPCLGLQRI